VSLFRSEIAHDLAAQVRVLRWVRALRSGRYRQAREYLRAGRSFCCLGVGCDQLDPRRWRRQNSTWSYQREWSELPQVVADDYLLRTTDGRYGPGTASLVADNDSGRTFAEIADVIERELAATIGRRVLREARR
jgi:hypothetical protein